MKKSKEQKDEEVDEAAEDEETNEEFDPDEFEVVEEDPNRRYDVPHGRRR